jgi:hypothetical protein
MGVNTIRIIYICAHLESELPSLQIFSINVIFEDETRINAEIVELFPVPGSPSSMFNG